jgi:hypothetical protein
MFFVTKKIYSGKVCDNEFLIGVPNDRSLKDRQHEAKKDTLPIAEAKGAVITEAFCIDCRII